MRPIASWLLVAQMVTRRFCRISECIYDLVHRVTRLPQAYSFVRLFLLSSCLATPAASAELAILSYVVLNGDQLGSRAILQKQCSLVMSTCHTRPSF